MINAILSSTLNLLAAHLFDSTPEEAMRQMLVTNSPLTTSVNAITWQDYIGMYSIVIGTVDLLPAGYESVQLPQGCIASS